MKGGAMAVKTLKDGYCVECETDLVPTTSFLRCADGGPGTVPAFEDDDPAARDWVCMKCGHEESGAPPIEVRGYVVDAQLELDLSPELPPIINVEDVYDRIEDRFLAFHELNPDVFRILHRMARVLRKDGHRRCSINLLFERCRWLHTLRTRGSRYRLNNSFRSFMARTIMAYDEDLEGFFDVRRQDTPWEPDLVAMGLRDAR